MTKVRLDVLVQQQASVSRSVAQGLILTGHVFNSDGERLEKPGHRYEEDTRLVIREGRRFVSRGGDKLEAALTHFDIDVSGMAAIDVGASTGGFTDCLLKHGARKVYAVDVGYGQLDWTLRQDPRVHVMERTNIRNVKPGDVAEAIEFFTVDCSFISIRLVLVALKTLLEESCQGVVLIKPQFEAGKDQVGKGGVVRDPEVHDRVLAEVRRFSEEMGFVLRDVIPSPLRGPAGNIEFLAHLGYDAEPG